jgi:hypothetical protein
MPRWIADVGPTFTDERGDHYTYRDTDGFVSATTIEIDAENEDDAWKKAAEAAAPKGWTVSHVEKVED